MRGGYSTSCKHFRSYLTGLDYKKLTDEDSDPLKALELVLSSQNVLSISKLASRMPQKGDGALTPSAVHATWLPKLFWQGDAHILKKSPQSDQDFLHAYDTCAKYLDRLVPLDAIHFLDSITFSLEATNQVSAVGAIDEFSCFLDFSLHLLIHLSKNLLYVLSQCASLSCLPLKKKHTPTFSSLYITLLHVR